MLVILSMQRQDLSTTLFPYTTLFRSFHDDPGIDEPRIQPSKKVPRKRGTRRKELFHGMQKTVFTTGKLAVIPLQEHTSELQSLRHLVCRLLLENNKLTKTACNDYSRQ